MSELLFEILSEEIPASMQVDAELQLVNLFKKFSDEVGLVYGDVVSNSGSRRLTICVKDLPSKIPAKVTEIRGPRINAPEAAINGFLGKNKLELTDLETQGEFYVAKVTSKEEDVNAVLKKVLENVLISFNWPKSMKWGTQEKMWVRPIRNILALFSRQVIDVEFAGVIANEKTIGHRFLGNKAVEVKDFADYQEKLKSNNVILTRQDRIESIQKQAAEIADKHGFVLKDVAKVIEENAGLIEDPHLMLGNIDSEFLFVPSEVLKTSMIVNQKYLPLYKKSGEFAANFILVANVNHGRKMIHGYEKVLRSRLSDAKFFYEQDLKVGNLERIEGLKTLNFHRKLGSVYDKQERLKHLAKFLSLYVKHVHLDQVENALEYAKTDLVSKVVYEFPELQGIMAGYYAEKQGLNSEISEGLKEQYQPAGPNDSVPQNPIGILISLSDKVDNLVGLFAAGEQPTGSKDQFGLRRAALAIIRIIIEHKIDIPLELAVEKSAKIYGDIAVNIEKPVMDFLAERLKNHLVADNIPIDLIRAVLIDESKLNILESLLKINALVELKSSKSGSELISNFKRVCNILKAEEAKMGDEISGSVDEDLLSEDAEISLHKTFTEIAPKITELYKANNYKLALDTLCEFETPIVRFFDNVIVNSDNQEVRLNRLKLLAEHRMIIKNFADFTVIENKVGNL